MSPTLNTLSKTSSSHMPPKSGPNPHLTSHCHGLYPTPVRVQGACPAAWNGRVESWLQWVPAKGCVHARTYRAISAEQWLGPTVLQRLYFRHINYVLSDGTGTYNSICITISMGKLTGNSKHTVQGFEVIHTLRRAFTYRDTHHLICG